MKEMLGMEKNKKILTIVLLASIILVLVGIYIVFFNTPKPLFLSMTDKINNELLKVINNNINVISVYDNDFVSNIDVDYYIEQDAQREEQTVVINKKTKKEEVVTNIVPYKKIYENKFNAYINKSQQNTHNIVKLTIPNEQEDKVYNIYEKSGQFVLDIPQKEKFVVLDSEKPGFSDVNSLFVNNIVDMYKIAYKYIKKNLPEEKFYRIEVNKEENIYKQGISIGQKELKEVFINTLQQLKSDSKFKEAYILYKKSNNINIQIDETTINQDIDNIINYLEQIEDSESLEYEFSITTQGLFNQKIIAMELLKTNNDLILNEIDISVNEDNIQLDYIENAKNILRLDVKVNDNGFDIKATNEQLNINLVGNNFYVSKEFVIQGDIQDKKVNGKFRIDIDQQDAEVINNLQMTIERDGQKVVNINLYGKSDLKTRNEYINTQNIYQKDNLEDEEKLYLEQFYIDVIDKLGIER